MAWRNFRIESVEFARAMRPHVWRLVKRPWDHHSHTNLFVEASGWPLNGELTLDQRLRVHAIINEGREPTELLPFRHSPGYYWGHWCSILWPLLVIVAAVGWYL